MHAAATLPADPHSISDARRFATSTLSEWGCAEICEVAALLVSELATNALLHAHSDIEIRLTGDQRELRVYVCDRSPKVPQVRRYSRTAGTGRGLRLVQTLSQGWGVDRRPNDGKCVWFTLSPGQVATAAEELAAYGEFDIDDVEPL